MIRQALRFGQILAVADFPTSDSAALTKERPGYLLSKRTRQAGRGVDSETAAAAERRQWKDHLARRCPCSLQRVTDVCREPAGVSRVPELPVWQNGHQIYPCAGQLGWDDRHPNRCGLPILLKHFGRADRRVPPPTRTEREEFIRTLPSRFASLPREHQQYLRRAEIRLQNLYTVYVDTIKTRAVVAADIRKNVHSAADVWREARQVENVAEYTARYYQRYRKAAVGAVLNANRVNTDIIALGGLDDRISQIMRSR